MFLIFIIKAIYQYANNYRSSHNKEEESASKLYIYVWKILEKLIPNIGNQIIEQNSSRRGRHCFQNTIKRTPYQNQMLITHNKWYEAFQLHPKENQEQDFSKEKFKNALDKYLKLIPDEPQVPGYTAEMRTNSNSILDMIKCVEQCDAACQN